MNDHRNAWEIVRLAGPSLKSLSAGIDAKVAGLPTHRSTKEVSHYGNATNRLSVNSTVFQF